MQQPAVRKIEEVTIFPRVQDAKVAPSTAPPVTVRVSKIPVRESNATMDGESLPTAHMKILRTLADLATVGVDSPPRILVAAFAGYSNAKSGGFAGPAGSLVSNGYVESNNGLLKITSSGRALVGDDFGIGSTEELHARISQLLDPPDWRILSNLIKIYPQETDRTSLATECGYSNPKSGGFAGPMGKLVTLGFARSSGPGMVAATELLFL
jgi:hypothetical protein